MKLPSFHGNAANNMDLQEPAIITVGQWRQYNKKYNFATQPNDALKCLICLDPSPDPMQHDKCGKLFCRECLNQYGKRKPCPYCQATTPDYFEDNKSKREFQSLHVKCDHSACEWEGIVSELNKHLFKCEFKPLPCSKGCHLQTIMKKDMDAHLANDCPQRDWECDYCGVKGTYTSITRSHMKICPIQEIPCPNEECRKVMKRKKVKFHLEECEFTEVPCKYMRFGCNIRLKRSAMPEHEEGNDKVHLRMALEKAYLQEEKEMTLSPGKSVIFKLTNFRARKEKDECVIFPSFYSSEFGYHLALEVYPNGRGDHNGTYLSVSVRVKPGRYDDSLVWPLAGTATVTLLNQQEDDNHMSKTLGENCCILVDDTWECTDFVHYHNLKTTFKKDDSMYFRVSVEIPDSKPWLVNHPSMLAKESHLQVTPAAPRIKETPLTPRGSGFPIAVQSHTNLWAYPEEPHDF